MLFFYTFSKNGLKYFWHKQERRTGIMNLQCTTSSHDKIVCLHLNPYTWFIDVTGVMSSSFPPSLLKI